MVLPNSATGLLGRIIDTLVATQLLAGCSVSELSPCMFHLRDGNGEHEVDILIELAAAASSRYR
jgi:hypothetical protein